MSREVRQHTRFRSLAHGLAVLVVAAFALPAPAQDPAPASTKTPPAAAVALRDQTVYRHEPFKMTVRPPIKLANGVSLEVLKFPSPVATEFKERNDVVRARLFHTKQPTRAAVIAIGGWKFDPLTPILAQRIAESGIQVVWIEIPYQGQRTPKGVRPGSYTLSSDMQRNALSFIQLTQDVARLKHWLVEKRNVDPEKIGLLGTSLGGFVSATLYGMHEKSYKAVVAQLAGVDVAGVIYNGNWLTKPLRRELEEQGLYEDDVRKQMNVMSPEQWVNPSRKDGVMIVAAELDEIVPLEKSQALSDLYGGARLIVMKGENHRAKDGLEKSLPKVREHFERVLLGRKPSGTAAEKPAPGNEDSPAPEKR